MKKIWKKYGENRTNTHKNHDNHNRAPASHPLVLGTTLQNIQNTAKIWKKYETNMKLYQQHENVVFEYLLHQGSHAMKWVVHWGAIWAPKYMTWKPVRPRPNLTLWDFRGLGPDGLAVWAACLGCWLVAHWAGPACWTGWLGWPLAGWGGWLGWLPGLPSLAWTPSSMYSTLKAGRESL